MDDKDKQNEASKERLRQAKEAIKEAKEAMNRLWEKNKKK